MLLDHVQVAMPAGREEAARAFYGAALGLREIPKPASLAARGGVWYAVGALQLHLGVAEDFPSREEGASRVSRPGCGRGCGAAAGGGLRGALGLCPARMHALLHR